MNNSKLPVVRIVKPQGQSDLSKAQKTFNKLIKQIDRKRKLLLAWQKIIPVYHAQYATEFDPLMQQFNQHKKEMVELLDKAYLEKGLTKNEKGKLRDILCSLSAALISGCGYTDLKEIYNRYSDSEFDSEIEEAQDMMRLMVKDMLGISLGDEFKFESTEEMMAHLGEKMQEKFAQEEKERQKKAERNAKRKKPSATISREARLHEETQNISRSIREVYRKLASALHPDLEQDVKERQRKTEMMQRANVLYDNKDLLGLLELQLEIEQIDQSQINIISEEKLIHYNKVLADQYAELRDEIHDAEMSFRLRFDIQPFTSLSPDMVMRNLQHDIKNLKQHVNDLKKDIVLFQDMKHIKGWLKMIPSRYLAERDIFFC